MTPHQPTALIAIGGNSLITDPLRPEVENQWDAVRETCRHISDLVERGWNTIVTHGNGPQVGFILRRGELVAPDASVEGLPNLPLWLAVADSQGGIGHMLAVALDTALDRAGLSSRAVAVLTHAEVALDDPAFENPTKPIGGQISAAVARLRVAEEGWAVTEVEPDVFRRVVPSPTPRTIVEAEPIRTLVASGAVVIAAGGGGIPVVRDDSGWHPVDAVIDKDRASALLAAEIDIGTLVLVTGVDQVYVDFNKPTQRALAQVGIEEMRRHLADGQFPVGSMGPKVDSAISFIEAGGEHAVITSLPGLRDALAGNGGTHLNADPHHSDQKE
jgi:carbamate kinase